ncbi:ankyrin repeat-containing domain protein [Apodospora peruviana]|uniref:Ankyrin repeat-containing domain protein n=1 Tax=Apodospora peruviana TaxID=516989 RepID=A0AAE0HZF1_9PEZI|nr:ankyrin repeat-containing domain protein [Apodospora peruviana]
MVRIFSWQRLLSVVCRTGNLRAVRSLLRWPPLTRPALEATNSHGETPLMTAVNAGHIPIVEVLLSQGADVNASRASDRWTPLHFATAHCHKKGADLLLSQLLINRGAAVNTGNDEGLPPLFFAIIKERAPMVRFLVSVGADINARDRSGQSMLCLAVKYASENMVRLLLELGAKFDVRNTIGKTELGYAIKQGRENVARMLLDKGANGNNRDQFQMTPLFYAARNGRVDMMELLLEQRPGTDFDARDVFRMTPLAHAALSARFEAVMFLLRKGANIDNANKGARTLLCVAASKGREGVVRWLLERWANHARVALLERVGDAGAGHCQGRAS